MARLAKAGLRSSPSALARLVLARGRLFGDSVNEFEFAPGGRRTFRGFECVFSWRSKAGLHL
jgi:hypothetical protein